MSDYQYLLDYPVTVDNAEEWVGAMAELLDRSEYQGSHRADEEI